MLRMMEHGQPLAGRQQEAECSRQIRGVPSDAGEVRRGGPGIQHEVKQEKLCPFQVGGYSHGEGVEVP